MLVENNLKQSTVDVNCIEYVYKRLHYLVRERGLTTTSFIVYFEAFYVNQYRHDFSI